MNRRSMLVGTGSLATAALAGCLGGSPGDGPGDGDGTDSPDDTPSGTGTPVESTFDVTKVTSGQGTNEATVTFGETVAVEGTIGGNNGCYTAVLKRATLKDGTLTVVVKAEEREDADACTQALVDVHYEADFAFGGEGPDEVVVIHLSMDERLTVAAETR